MADPSIISFHFSRPSQPPGSSQALPPTCLDLYPYDSTPYAGNQPKIFSNFLHSTFDIRPFLGTQPELVSWTPLAKRLPTRFTTLHLQFCSTHSRPPCSLFHLRAYHRHRQPSSRASLLHWTGALNNPSGSPAASFGKHLFSSSQLSCHWCFRRGLGFIPHNARLDAAAAAREREMAYTLVFQFTVLFASHFICFK